MLKPYLLLVKFGGYLIVASTKQTQQIKCGIGFNTSTVQCPIGKKIGLML
jgi:hypothetical protein